MLGSNTQPLTHNTKLKSGVNFKIMSHKKQTSVDVLFEILWECPRDKWEWNAVLKEVREIHKQEMKDLYLAHVTKAPRLRQIFEKQFEEYYTNTFE